LSLSSTGGAGGYTYQVVAGALPSGMTLSPAGVIGGVPNASATPGAHTLTIRSTDSTGCSGDQSYTLRVFCPTLTVNPSTLPPARQYSAYSQALLASGGTAPYTWSVSPAPLTGATAWWPGEDGAGEVMLGNAGAVQNGAAFTTGRIARAFSFDGVDDHVTVSDHSSQRPAQISLKMPSRPEIA
jgi:hypothetical protein